MSKTVLSICLCSRLSLSFQKKGGGSAESNVENCAFHLSLLSPFTIFAKKCKTGLRMLAGMVSGKSLTTGFCQ